MSVSGVRQMHLSKNCASFDYNFTLHQICSGSSGVEHYVDIVVAGGSNPLSNTTLNVKSEQTISSRV